MADHSRCQHSPSKLTVSAIMRSEVSTLQNRLALPSDAVVEARLTYRSDASRTESWRLMVETKETPWPLGWTATKAPQVRFAFVRADGGEWVSGRDQGIERRDLGLCAASDGGLDAQHVRINRGLAGATSTWRREDAYFRLFYVLSGRLAIDCGEAGMAVLRPDDAVQIPSPMCYRLQLSTDDVELIDISVPAVPDAPPGDHGESLVVSPEAADSWIQGAGPRRFFSYRDLHTREHTEQRLHLHAVRAAQRFDGGTGWHYHTMAQIFVVLEGEGMMSVEDHGTHVIRAGDAMCISAGARMRHNLSSFSDEYRLIELCAPATYDTISTDPPLSSRADPEAA